MRSAYKSYGISLAFVFMMQHLRSRNVDELDFYSSAQEKRESAFVYSLTRALTGFRDVERGTDRRGGGWGIFNLCLS